MIEEFGVIETLKNLRETFTQTETRIVSYILKQPEIIPGMTIHDLASNTDTSSAAVSRLCKKIGCESFQLFKIKLSNELGSGQHQNPETLLEASEPLEIQRILLASSQHAIEETLNHLDYKNVESVVALLKDASVIFVFGLGLSGLAADNIFQKWTRVGKTVLLIQEESMGKMMLSQLHTNAVFWGISNSGNSEQVIDITKTAQSYGVPTIVMTRRAPSKLAEIADVTLYTAKVSKKPSAISNSLYAQFSLTDYVFAVYIKDLEERDKLIYSY
ncbi:MurR/RpiR family transcriptional regulator [Erysipelothrix tonsillarum]|uniref:MurR/RpiR family transcriptional regulator n=1 Tax=Erysipelothrix tonsillarum TaxID=38402 RepID=UPI00035FE544|nr:MurR/RpiR family transcriptional regulator [Erysipelothrix tonsillarum]